MSKAKKIVWAYMLKNGHLTDGSYSYYGGSYNHPKGLDPYSKKGGAAWKLVLDKVKSIGVDWEKTDFPKTESHSVFIDSFATHNEYKEVLLGTIYLKDGSSYLIGSTDEDKMSGYISYAVNEENLEKTMKEVFGKD